MKFNILVGLLIIGILFSCKKENECEGLVVGPDYTISQNTKSYLSNYSNNNKIIYLNLSSNQEVEFTIDTLNQYFSSYSGIGPCPADTTINASINGNSESIKLAIGNSVLDQSIIYSLSEFPEAFGQPDSIVEKNWEILIQYGSIDDSPTNAESVMILELDQMIYNTISDSISIDGNVFYDVLEINDINPGFELPVNPSLEVKLTKEEGIIYINDKINNRELVYLRVE